MFSSLRNYSKIIIILIAVAMVVTGGLMGYGSYLSSRSTSSGVSLYIAQINDAKITQEEYYSILQSQAAQTAQLSTNQLIPYRMSILDYLIEKELILQEAKKMGLKAEISEEEVEEYLNQILEAYGMTEEDLAANLQEQGSSTEALKQDLKASMEEDKLIQLAQEQSYSKVTVSEEEIIREYEAVQPLVIVKGISEENEQEAKEAMEEALAAIKDGADFTEVAQEYSDFNNGDLGFLSRDNVFLPAEVIEEALKLEKGQVSDIIQTEDAFYIVKVLDKKLAQGEDYEKAKADLQEQLLQEKQSKAFTNWLESVKGEAQIEIFDPILKGYDGLRKGDYQVAVNEFEAVLEVSSSPIIYTYLAQAYNGLDNPEKAKATFNRALEEYPENWELYFNYGNFLASLGEAEIEEALAAYDEASKYAGEDFMAHYQLFLAFSSLDAEERANNEMEILTQLQEAALESTESAETTEENPEQELSTEQTE